MKKSYKIKKGLSVASPALGIQASLSPTLLPNTAVSGGGVVSSGFLNIQKKVPLLPTPGIVLPTATIQPPQVVNPVLGSQGTITVPAMKQQPEQHHDVSTKSRKKKFTGLKFHGE